MIDILHTGFADACGGVAFRMTERPVRHAPVEQTKARLLDGTTPDAGMPVICGSCGRIVSMAELEPKGGYA